jgi:hypothetical protein
LDWRAKVKLIEQIRLEYEFGVGTIQGVARKLRVNSSSLRGRIARNFMLRVISCYCAISMLYCAIVLSRNYGRSLSA